jgi:hypothetical protein
MFEFLSGPNAMLLGTRDSLNVPAITRPIGCQVCPDREHVMAFLADSRAIAHIRQTRVLALVVVRPTTYEGYQLKAVDAEIEPLTDEQRAAVVENRAKLLEEMARVGLTPEIAATVVPRIDSEVVAAVFSPSAIFRQTPGPGAGERRES